ncbi:hypothetical protein C3B51_21295 [Pseudoalteromonas rubra]|uniref:Uncharacterized protein n=1 Tax=Pseudoalteromonas rubra TaxID=43658 RepID=A0A4Q7DYX9_9GAMM|nr:phosphoribosyltransferase [Pseudoalteromonas rubra]RZM73151.1 hypothetical protein C3B51_21295 [Pseudoalteromonas rubra]
MENKAETLEEAFSSQFTDPLFYKRIKQFAAQLNEASKDGDVMILMARKAVCLYSMLDKLGLVKPSCPVTSSRVLDYNPSWLSNKRVILVDDLIIKGTTLLTVTNQLYQKHCVKSVEIHVVAVNEDTAEERSKFKLDSGTCLFDDHVHPSRTSLKNQKCTMLSSQIVRSFIASAHPYISDFAISEAFKVGVSSRSALVKIDGWKFIDTTVYHVNKNVFTISYIPGKEKKKLIEHKLGLTITPDYMLKIRLHCRIEGMVIYCTAVPIFLFPPMYKSDIEKLFQNLHSRIKDPCENFIKGVSSTKGKLLIIQYICSLHLLKLFEKQINTALPEDKVISIQRNINDTAFLFPPSILQTIDYIAENVDRPLKGNEKHEKVIPLPSSSISLPNGTERNHLCQDKIKFLLQQPFENLYEKYEVELAKKVYQEDDSILNLMKEDETKSTLNRLNKGISFPALKSILPKNLENKEYYFHKNVDRMIDCGIAVPITGVQEENQGKKYKNAVYYRALRHGEEVIIGPRERILICTYIFIISQELNKWTYGKVEFQKILVLLFRASTKKDFLNFSDIEGEEEVSKFHLSFYLYGAVVSNITDLKSNGESLVDKYLPKGGLNSITEYLESMTNGYVTIERNTIRINKNHFPRIYRQEHKKPIGVMERVKEVAAENHQITELAYYIVSLFRANFKTDEFVVLSSLLTPHQRALAVSAELSKLQYNLNRTVDFRREIRKPLGEIYGVVS